MNNMDQTAERPLNTACPFRCINGNILINDKDRREFSIEITHTGLSEIEKAGALIQELNASLERKMGKEKLAALKEILSDLNEIIQSGL